MSAAKRKALSLKEKIAILDEVDAKKKKLDIASEHGIPPSTLSTIISQSDKLRSVWIQTAGCSEAKRMKKASSEELEEALLKWFTQQRSLNVPISGPMLAAKAMQFAAMLGVADFKASNGFLDNFKRRHSLSFKVISGEAASANTTAAESWTKEVLPHYLQRYSPRDVYNADETSLFYQMLPSHTLAFKGETCTGGKHSKIRVTILVCANMDGTDKRKILVIGKSAKPRCFKGIKMEQLPVEYKSNVKAWMTSKVWLDWLHQFDRKMNAAKRKVLLIVDNVSSHIRPPEMAAVELVYLPPNTTSRIQPCDQGIINSLKMNYRRRLLNRLWLDGKKKFDDFQINLLDAIYLCAAAWEDVSSTTVSNCFRHAGFTAPQNPGDSDAVLSMDGDNVGPARSVFDFLYKEFPDIRGSVDTSLEDYLAIDSMVATEEIVSDAGIIELVNNNEATTDAVSDEESDQMEQSPVSASTAFLNLMTLRSYCIQRGLDTRHIDMVEQEMAHARAAGHKQMRITDFFVPR